VDARHDTAIACSGCSFKFIKNGLDVFEGRENLLRNGILITLCESSVNCLLLVDTQDTQDHVMEGEGVVRPELPICPSSCAATSNRK